MGKPALGSAGMNIWDAFTEAEEGNLDEAAFAALLVSKYGYTVEKAEDAAAIAYGGAEGGALRKDAAPAVAEATRPNEAATYDQAAQPDGDGAADLADER